MIEDREITLSDGTVVMTCVMADEDTNEVPLYIANRNKLISISADN